MCSNMVCRSVYIIIKKSEELGGSVERSEVGIIQPGGEMVFERFGSGE